MDGEPKSELTEEIGKFLNEKESPANRLKTTAQEFLSPLGYADLPRQAIQYSHQEGPVRKLEELVPSLPRLTIGELAGRMKRVPDHNEAETLLILAMNGTFPEGKEGDSRTVSFNVREHPLDVYSGIASDAGYKEKRSVVNKAGTDKLAESLILPGFLEQGNLTPADVIGKLGSTAEMTLVDPATRRRMTIRRNIERDKKSKDITSYSYTFRTELL